MAHSKLPWHRGQGNGEGYIFADQGRMRLEKGGTALYSICQMTMAWEPEEDEANARLIAAAPELLQELAEFVAEHGDNCDCSACRAIAKAEGRDS